MKASDEAIFQNIFLGVYYLLENPICSYIILRKLSWKIYMRSCIVFGFSGKLIVLMCSYKRIMFLLENLYVFLFHLSLLENLMML